MMQFSYTELKVNHQSIVAYPRFIRESSKRGLNIKSRENLVKGTPKGVISKKTAKKVTEMVITLHNTVNVSAMKKSKDVNTKIKPLSFITLTLSDKQIHSDKEIKRNMLNEFLIRMKRNEKMLDYIWKAEPQKNGNIHFHIITPCYIDKFKVSKHWNNIQLKNGYLDNYYSKKGHWNAPSVKIEGTKSINHTAYYCAKYISKDEQVRLIEGRVWGCSDSLKRISVPKIQETEALHTKLKVAVNTGKLKEVIKDFCIIYIGNIFEVMADDYDTFGRWYCSELLRNWRAMREKPKQTIVLTESKPYICKTLIKKQLELWN